ncbi:MAG: hypothetical protein L6R38_009015 [Xanthoria sp. 2 TBL-2021]|nr:MAG: hypothetical protein L6R38_009015 [Xanthoria sp. 2 TBL-2021]
MIYNELIPNQVAIYPHENSQHRFKHPWTLISVSKQFRQAIRHEISSRMTAYVRIRKVLYDGVEGREAYEADMMERDIYLGPLLTHLVINRSVEIKWKPDNDIIDAPVWRKIQPDDPPSSELYKLVKGTWSNDVYYSAYWETFAERIGDWQVLWRSPTAQLEPCMYNIRIVLAAIDKPFGKKKIGTAMPGLRKIDIVRLVAAYRGLGFMDGETDDEMADGMANPQDNPATSEQLTAIRQGYDVPPVWCD